MRVFLILVLSEEIIACKAHFVDHVRQEEVILFSSPVKLGAFGGCYSINVLHSIDVKMVGGGGRGNLGI